MSEGKRKPHGHLHRIHVSHHQRFRGQQAAGGSGRLSAEAVERIVRAVEPFEYEKVYGAFWDTVIDRDGKAVVQRSAERYLRAIGR